MRILRLLLLIVILAGAFYAFQEYRRGGFTTLQSLPQKFLTSTPVQNAVDIDTNQIKNLAADPGPELKILAERSKEVSEHAENVLGDTISVNEEAPPIHERALEYGRYLYCQQVVEDYESSRTP
jgi:hypothetical protein